jgi:FkbM family methyltransferase
MSLKLCIYKTGFFSNLLRSGVNRFVPEGKTTVEVISGELTGARLSLYLKSEKDYWLGTYESELQDVIKQKVSPGMIVYDLGANIGYLSFLFSKLVTETGRVYAFEALPENVARIEENLSLNPGYKNIEIVPKAVTDNEEKVEFLIGPSPGTGKVMGSAGRQNFTYQRGISVEGTSIDHYVFTGKKPEPGLVKIDIEGGEMTALSGMKLVLNQIKPLILLELHGPEAASVSWKILQDAGYKIYQIKQGYSLINSPDGLGWKSHILAENPN